MAPQSSRGGQQHADEPHENPNVFDDEYAADSSDEAEFAGISDGFRPSATNNTSNDASQARRSVSLTKQPDARQHLSRSSIAKPPFAASSSVDGANEALRNPFSDPPPIPSPRPANAAQALMHRASVASTSSFATTVHRSESPAGPSHPYAMYPQATGGVSRTTSFATTASRTPQGSISGERPQHPYGMYPQNPVDDGEDDAQPVARPPLPVVGFPGHVHDFHRQIGPDGEEQDIIGPDGHTEQLPPYSRYPTEAPPKINSPSVSPISPTARNLENGTASQSTLLLPTTVAAHTASRSPLTPLQNVTSSAPSLQSSQRTEKNWKQKTWSEKRKTKVCGRVPVWLAILLIGLLLVFAVILGAAIGAMMSKSKPNKPFEDKPQAVIPPSKTLIGALDIPAPTNAAQLVEVGIFDIPFAEPEETQRNCLTDPTQANAWSCRVEGPMVLMTIEMANPNITSCRYRGHFSSQDFSNDGFSLTYGARAPEFQPQPMQFVKDLDEPSRGPALHFQTLYDKVVVLPNDFVSSKKRRDAHFDSSEDYGDRMDLPPDFIKNRNRAQLGDLPWICYFNQTFIEAYVYVNQNSTFAERASSTEPFPGATEAPSPVATSYTPSSPAIPTNLLSEPSALSIDELTFRERDQAYDRNVARDEQYGPMFYPRVVKVEERRLPNSPPAYCEQVEIIAGGFYIPRLDENGDPIMQWLNEQDPKMVDFTNDDGTNSSEDDSEDDTKKRRRQTSARRRRSDFSRLRLRGDPSDACHCQWKLQ